MYGCRRSTGRRVKLDTKSSDGITNEDTYDRVQIVDNHVSWVSTLIDQSCKAACPPGFDAPTIRIAVKSISTRKFRSVVAAPIDDAIVLSAKGAVAWAAKGSAPGVVEIHASPRGTEDRIVDSGNINTGSLAIEISIISWMRDGAERFARLR